MGRTQPPSLRGTLPITLAEQKRKNEVKRTCNFCPLLNSSCP
nr:MAG TPA: hypothetical protein [Caudoviricetes sp.]DAT72166.1 MAG TPA: hypothetical protein [Caudoviricetes sp.]